ncbi:MAG: CPBP family intramembrane metalloprotease [Rickettsiales bacterium]|nr:CPBP family intramembrane metalloprotease [Rickettsiales bacterium]
MSTPLPRSSGNRILEGIGIFLVLPAWIAWVKPLGWVYLILWMLVMYCGYRLQTQHSWNFRQDWNKNALTWPLKKRLLIRFIPFGVALTAFTLYMIPQSLLILPRSNPALWLSIMILYPLVSVLPQEIIARSFFFRRYGPLLSEARLKILSALSFGWMHIIMQNWEAVVFSAIGGWLFADTYMRTKSLAAVFFEHALYGCFVFTIGLGYFFYHGNAMR